MKKINKEPDHIGKDQVAAMKERVHAALAKCLQRPQRGRFIIVRVRKNADFHSISPPLFR